MQRLNAEQIAELLTKNAQQAFQNDRLRFQTKAVRSDLEPQPQPLRDQSGRRLLVLGFAALALGMCFPALDRLLNPDTPSLVLRLIGAGAALMGGLIVLWADVYRLKTDHRQVKQFDWSTFFEVLTVALLSVALGVIVLVNCLQNV